MAQSNVDSTSKFCWTENVGWLNWRDAGNPAATQDVFLDSAGEYMSGFIWGENVGWINVGNGAGPYANTNGTNFGVNWNSATKELSGFAWGENIGWINFSGGAMATPAQPAKFDAENGRFIGYAWGENIGWINLDVADDGNGKFVRADVGCDAIDFNRDGVFPDTQDIFDLVFVFSSGACPTPLCNDIDFNNDGVFPDNQDIFDFVFVFGGGACPG
jgi:hypothetical protein